MTERAHLERIIGAGEQPHRWAVIGANGLTVSMSSEQYLDARDAEHGAVLTLRALLHDLDADTVGELVAEWMSRGEDQAGAPPR
jgi:hypothetical protein